MTGVWPRSTAASGVATGGRSTEGFGMMSTRMRPTLTPDPTWAAYVTVEVPGVWPVTVSTPVSRLVSSVSCPGPLTAWARRIRACGSVGSAPAMSLPSGWSWTGLPTTARTTSGWVRGRTGFVSSSLSTSRPTDDADAHRAVRDDRVGRLGEPGLPGAQPRRRVDVVGDDADGDLGGSTAVLG